jgi:hypothetical protein
MNRGTSLALDTNTTKQRTSNGEYDHLADEKWSPGLYPNVRVPVIVKVVAIEVEEESKPPPPSEKG